jgi:glycosyltransferase involved in cell wall biosynthesis
MTVMPDASDYWVMMTTRDRPDPLLRSLDSLKTQSIPPKEIVVLDDGSSDPSVGKVLEALQGVHIIVQKDTPYDIKRIVKNWNRCLEYAERNGFASLPYIFVTADDCLYPPYYAETLIGRMTTDSVVVASGNRGLKPPPDGWKPPEGSGRMIEAHFLHELSFRFPEQAGYEPWIVYEALRRGRNVACYNDLAYDHISEFGGSHRFAEWSFMPHALGYDPVFFYARCIKNALNGDLPKAAALKMMFGYVVAPFKDYEDKTFYRYFSPELRAYVKEFQRKRLLAALNKYIGFVNGNTTSSIPPKP